jgi:hypothetical protein
LRRNNQPKNLAPLRRPFCAATKHVARQATTEKHRAAARAVLPRNENVMQTP